MPVVAKQPDAGKDTDGKCQQCQPKGRMVEQMRHLLSHTATLTHRHLLIDPCLEHRERTRRKRFMRQPKCTTLLPCGTLIL